MISVSDAAYELHRSMMDDRGKVYEQGELQRMSGSATPQALMAIVQELTNAKLIKLLQQGTVVTFQAVSMEDASKVQAMSADEEMVYSYVEAAGREGIWTKTIRAKTNLHQQVVARCLKNLESQRHIKAIKSVKFPTRKIYMLSSLEPSIEVTGGPWFSESEMDTVFISKLMDIVWAFIVEKSFPREALNRSKIASQKTYPVSYRSYPTVAEVHRHIVSSGVSTVELELSDIRQLCEVLVYDDRLERRDGGHSYRATWKSVVAQANAGSVPDLDGFTEAPCGRCPVFSLCEDNGPVNPKECIYLDKWIDL